MKTPLAYTQTHTDTHTLNLVEFDKVGHKRKQHNKNRERDTPSTNDLLNILLRETSARKRLHCGSNVSSVNINILECVMSGLLYWLRRITIRNILSLSVSLLFLEMMLKATCITHLWTNALSNSLSFGFSSVFSITKWVWTWSENINDKCDHPSIHTFTSIHFWGETNQNFSIKTDFDLKCMRVQTGQ